jgi:hypothetical protein
MKGRLLLQGGVIRTEHGDTDVLLRAPASSFDAAALPPPSF